MEEKQFKVPPEAANARIDSYLAAALKDQFSRTKIKQLIEDGLIQLNQKSVKPHTHVAAEDEIVVRFERRIEETNRAEAIPIDVVYEDEDLMVVNKPAGMVVHPGSGNPKGTMVNALLHYSKSLSSFGPPDRPGIVHRLDKNTSGLIVVAKNDVTHRGLADQFKQHSIERCYWVVVKGVVQHDEMRCEEPLGRSLVHRKKVVVRADDGKRCITNFKVLKRYQNQTLLEARPETGRMHQIRVHLRALAYPVLGDTTYGVNSSHITRQALHAKELGFTHPKSKKHILLKSDLPDDMALLLETLEKQSRGS
jgi:23S rRNA pseudouridine1911/1915/1917 synthase